MSKKKKQKDILAYVNNVFDLFDRIDRELYGKRLKIAITLSIVLSIVLPILNFISDSESIATLTDYLTYLATFFAITVVFAWIGSMRDDDEWSWKKSFERMYSRLKIYYYIILEKAYDFKDKDKKDRIYLASIYLLVLGIGIRGLQVVLIFMRGIMEWITADKWNTFRYWDKHVTYFAFICIVVGFILLAVVIKKDPDKIKSKFSIPSRKKGIEFQSWENIKIFNEFVVSLNDEVKMGTLMNKCNNPLLFNFLKAMQNWNPNTKYLECSYRDRLCKHLWENLSDVETLPEYPLKEFSHSGQRLKADIVVGDTILIEMKQHPNSTNLQKAKGQVEDYLNVWRGRGPVVLVLCHADLEIAKRSLEQFISDQNKLNKVVFALVIEPKWNTA
ncbi:MAG: hypothetical protein IPL26_07165 [Leptospiraceae bacterium]|nr:hypothetical protein [Leptospiraceae bacterium]